MLIKVLHQEKGSRKLLAEFPNKAFELIPTVFIVLETCVFSLCPICKTLCPTGKPSSMQHQLFAFHCTVLLLSLLLLLLLLNRSIIRVT